MNQEIEKYLDSEIWFNYSNFYNEVAEKKYRVLVELGTWKGHSIMYLAKKLKQQNYDFDLYGVDLFDDSPIHENKGNEYLKPQMKYLWDVYNENLIRSNVREVVKDIKKNSWEAANEFENESVDFIFIDADHKYESVVKDIQAWLPKLKVGGVMSGHDYTQPTAGVKKAVEELLPDFKLGTDEIWIYIK